MRTITNDLGLPQPLVDAVRSFDHERKGADITVTELIAPPRQQALLHTHEHEITEDASARIFALLGQIPAAILERANHHATGHAEHRLTMRVLDWTIAGTTDHLSLTDQTLRDWKVTSVWTVKAGGKSEWEQQLNVYAQLWRVRDRELIGVRESPERLQVVAILRDWSKREAERDATYPQQQVVVLDVPLWPEIAAQHFIAERVQQHQLARDMLKEGVAPYCTAEEKWQRADAFAVMKSGRKSALRVFGSLEDAKAFQATQQVTTWVETRPGVAIRCQSYCPVATFCQALGDGGYGPVPTTQLED